MRKIKIFTGSSHPSLARKICRQLNIPLSPLEIKEYTNGCFEVILKDNVCEKTVFLIQTSLPNSCRLHRNIWELCQMINAALKSGAKEAVVIMPYISYARSSKIYTFGMTVSGELLVKLLEASGMKRFIGIDFHSREFEKCFSKKEKLYHLSALSLIAAYLGRKNLENTVLLSADQGASKSASFLAERLNLLLGSVEKERISDTKVKIKKINSKVFGKDIIVVDDEISTGATARTLGKKLEKLGAKNLTIAVTHGLFAGEAIANLQEIKILKQVIVSDTVPISREARKSLPLKILSVAEVLAKTIREITKED